MGGFTIHTIKIFSFLTTGGGPGTVMLRLALWTTGCGPITVMLFFLKSIFLYPMYKYLWSACNGCHGKSFYILILSFGDT